MTDDATPHRRFNPLNGSWVLVSPHRTARPWQGQQETREHHADPRYVADCYLCPGNARAAGARNPDYDDVFVFDNDFPALLADSAAPGDDSPLLRAEAVTGRCRVICYSPRHDLTMARMPRAAIRRVVDAWADEYARLARQHRWVQIFENRGALMGCSNPHPHGQVWATSTLPTEAVAEAHQQRDYAKRHDGRTLLGDYADTERRHGTRVLIDSAHWLLVVPYWAVWPFETLLIARDDAPSLDALSDAARDDLAAVLQRLCAGYDRVFDTPFPYSMGWHNAPAGDPTGWRLHAHFYPPLLRSATVRKFMVGYEMLAEPQRDLTPEAGAAQLRAAIERADTASNQ